MKNRLSFFACILIAIALLSHRAVYPLHSDKPLKVTDWDIRLKNPIARPGDLNNYAFDVRVPQTADTGTLTLCISSTQELTGDIHGIGITSFVK